MVEEASNVGHLPRAVLNRIPGGGMPLAKPENHTKDLSKLTRAELQEMRDRESKLLADKAKMNRLPDKGKRLQDLHDRIVAELEKHTNIEQAAEMFSALNIAATGKAALDELEWKGRWDDALMHPSEDVLDSDDELEMDPLRILAQRTMHERSVKILPPEKNLITAEDLEQIATFHTDSPDSGLSSETTIEADIVAVDVANVKPQLQEFVARPELAKEIAATGDGRSITPASAEELEPHVHYLVGKTEPEMSPHREKFKPYQTTITNVHEPAKERGRKQQKYWENTAATPPLIQHNAAQLITLLDSVDIQINYLAKLKELQERQANERLAARAQRLELRQMQLPPAEVLKTKTTFTAYRMPADAVNRIEGERTFNELEEVYDPLDVEKPGGVVHFSVHVDD